jgi:phosphohistidine phosphatase
LKTIYLCRHAKSSWADPGMADFDRPLNQRGRRNAPMMARKFRERNEEVDLLVTSTAGRAITTARFFSEALQVAPNQLVQEPRIYEASVRTILEVINGLPADADRVMLFGHNPGFSNMIDHLTNEPLGNLPTCGIARIDLALDDWKAVTKGLGRLIWLDHPKMYEEEQGSM